MKRLFLLLGCLAALIAHADTEVVDGIEWTYTISNGKASVGSGYNSVPAVPRGTEGVIVIPSSLGGVPVTSIGRYAFYDCSSLTSVTIPKGVTSIGDGAFRGCSSLTSFSLPASVTSMPENALPLSSNNLKTLEVAPDNPLYCTENNILYNKTKTRLLRIAGGRISGSFAIPEGVTSIGDFAFYDCSSLTSVTIPEGVTSIGIQAFYGCSSLTSVTIPEGVTSIGGSAFSGCSSLTSVTIPEGVKTLEGTFSGCTSLRNVKLPFTLTSIGTSTFGNCCMLYNLTIPASVNTIASMNGPGSYPFEGCRRLKDMFFLGNVPTSFGNSRGALSFPMEYASNWEKSVGSRRGTYIEIINRAGVTARAEMTMPKTMRVTYSVKSEKEKVKVRAVAFKDGVRSFANVVPVKSGTDVPNGAEVTANEEHTFVWDISKDWDIDLAKVAVEILVEEGVLLPQELITIPGAPMNRADITITQNTISGAQAFDALLWCYAEGDSRITVSYGRVSIDDKCVAIGEYVATYDGNGSWFNPDSGYNTAREWYCSTLLNYLYGKMGYKVLSGEDYTYAKAATRLDLAKEGLGQVSVKIAETAKE